ncbi:MAG: response regulator [Tissierellia bacterium]|nr:response regulator [Tissierellia bacterium]MDD4725940.1 response regulator [Tissierellia bacterium]
MSTKILVIDDDKEILFAMTAICEYKDWISITAISVLEGIERLKKYKPDLVLIDYHLPIYNGIEGVKRLRKINSKVPIIVLTVEEDQNVADDFMSAGASDFALKPIKAPDIISRINVHLKMKDTKTSSTINDYEYFKGITNETLEIIEIYMNKYNNKSSKYYSISEIAKGTGLAYQTVHRYLQHMEEENKVEVNYKYGKVGRPQKRFKIIV